MSQRLAFVSPSPTPKVSLRFGLPPLPLYVAAVKQAVLQKM